MKYRKLRIAWSAVCGILCLLLIMLWARSYWRFDYAIMRVSKFRAVEWRSQDGRLVTSPFRNEKPLRKQWDHKAYPKMDNVFVDQDGRDILAALDSKRSDGGMEVVLFCRIGHSRFSVAHSRQYL
jgi:hypothetical protein